MRDLLVTGTDTGVGKTVIAAAIVHARRAAGIASVGWKPVQTGVEEGVPTDAEELARAAPGVEPELCAPLLSLREPLAPAVAAQRAGLGVSLAEVIARVHALRARELSVVVEGAGGLLVPLGWTWTAADLAVELGLPVVVVARAGLGTLNATALTVEALQRRGLAVAGVVLNGRAPEPDLAEQTNPDALSRLLGGLPLVVVPRLADASPAAVAACFGAWKA